MDALLTGHGGQPDGLRRDADAASGQRCRAPPLARPLFAGNPEGTSTPVQRKGAVSRASQTPAAALILALSSPGIRHTGRVADACNLRLGYKVLTEEAVGLGQFQQIRLLFPMENLKQEDGLETPEGATAEGMNLGKYDGLSQDQLIQLLEKHDRQKKLGLVWERDEIEADKAVDANFVACTLDAELSEKQEPWGNLVIEGDNYDALRWLRVGFSGRIKCIYIDPPYNTGAKDWVYNDRYFDVNDRFRHSTWLEFLYRRLTLARDLLAEDGAILVSINDENRALLELLMDEALPGMRLGSLVWRSRTGGNEGGEAFLSENHEHVLVYGNRGFRFAGTEKTYEMYRYFDEEKKDWYRLSDLTKAHDATERKNTYYPLHDPEADIWYPCNPTRVWAYATVDRVKPGTKLRTKTIEQLKAEKRIAFPKDQKVGIWETRAELLAAIEAGDVPHSNKLPLIWADMEDLDFWVGKKVGFGTPSYKRFKGDLKNPTQPLSSWITPKSEDETVIPGTNTIVSGSSDEGAKAIKDIFGSKAFNYAKPTSLIRELIRQASSPGDIILDFFAGSATTAQAVMELNAEDGGDRRFIMVSSTEATQEEPDKNLCRDICAQRIRKLNAQKDSELSAEFAYLRTREIDFEDLDYEVKPAEVWNTLEAVHGLPLTRYEAEKPWNEHVTNEVTLIYVDKVTVEILEKIGTLSAAKANAFVYAWAPGQITSQLPGVHVEIRPVHETLVKRFQQ